MYKCEICDMECKSNESLKKHFNYVHNLMSSTQQDDGLTHLDHQFIVAAPEYKLNHESGFVVLPNS